MVDLRGSERRLHRARSAWAVRDDEYLRKFWPACCERSVATALGRSRAAVRARASRLGLVRGQGEYRRQRWSQQQTEQAMQMLRDGIDPRDVAVITMADWCRIKRLRARVNAEKAERVSAKAPARPSRRPGLLKRVWSWITGVLS